MYPKRYSKEQTAKVAQALLDHIAIKNDTATVIALSGDLGAGKTTLVQAIGSAMGIEDTIQSPTFVIARFYQTRHPQIKTMVHIDAYRIDDVSELDPIGWDRIISQPDTLVVIEWPERIADVLPRTTERFFIEHDGDERVIRYEKN